MDSHLLCREGSACVGRGCAEKASRAERTVGARAGNELCGEETEGCIVVAGNWTPLPCRRVTVVPSPYHTHSHSLLARDVEAPEAGGHSLRALKVSLREQVTCGPAPFPLLPGPSQPHWQPKAAGLPGAAARSQNSVLLGVWQATHVPRALPSCPCRTPSG